MVVIGQILWSKPGGGYRKCVYDICIVDDVPCFYLASLRLVLESSSFSRRKEGSRRSLPSNRRLAALPST